MKSQIGKLDDAPHICDTHIRTAVDSASPDSGSRLDPDCKWKHLRPRNSAASSSSRDGWTPDAASLCNSYVIATSSSLRNVMTLLCHVRVNRITSVIFLLLTAASMLHSSRADPDLLKMQFAVDSERTERGLTQAQTQDAEGAQTCAVSCAHVRHKPVCGTDGRTYSHKCELKRLRRCEGSQVQMATRGPCTRGVTRGRATKCVEQRRQALTQPRGQRAAGTYIPECTTEGAFAEVQCHQETGYCWCVTPEGTPIPGSSVQGKAEEVRCRATKGCSPTERAQFNRNLIALFSVEFDRIPKPTQPKSPVYPGAGYGLPIQSGSDAILDTPEKRVIEWKFSELDINKDNLLRRKEIRSLKRMVKKLVDPKACAKTFDSYCDLDGDKKVARAEWSMCLGVDINNDGGGSVRPPPLRRSQGPVPLLSSPSSTAAPSSSHRRRGEGSNRDRARERDAPTTQRRRGTATTNTRVTNRRRKGRNNRNSNHRRRGSRKGRVPPVERSRGAAPGGVPQPPRGGQTRGHDGRHFPSLLRSSSTTTTSSSSATAADVVEEQRPSLWNRQQPSGLNFGNRPRPADELQQPQQQQNTQSETSSKLDCTEERRNAEEMDRMDPEGRIFIPECLPDGKYRPEQCHKSTGYCWCVNEDNGKPIPGTSTHNVRPDCSTATYRVFKGCPYPQRKRFLVDLIDRLTTQMVEYANNNTDSNSMPEPNPDHSFEERVARWKLKVLDKNNNQVLERRETKNFKNELKEQVKDKRALRKCGRNFVRFCDENKDKRITTEEWINCMGLNEQERNLPKNPKRKGENPFKKYLKG